MQEVGDGPEGRERHGLVALLAEDNGQPQEPLDGHRGTARHGIVEEVPGPDDEPLVVGVLRRDEAPWFVAQGLTRSGEPLSGTTLVYTASLSKQLVAGCAAVLALVG